MVVILGLLVVYLTQHFQLPSWLGQADAAAALGVSGIVIWVSVRLARETIDALTDRAPEELAEKIKVPIEQVKDVTEVRRVRTRRAGNKTFADVIIAAPRTLTFEQTHMLTESVEKAAIDGAHSISPQGEIDVVVHVEPTTTPTETVTDQIHYLAELQGVHAHDIHVREVNGGLEADFDVEVQSDMELDEAHAVATRLEQAVLQSNDLLYRVTTHLEAPNNGVVRRRDVTHQYPEMAVNICRIANGIAGNNSAHEIHLYRSYSASADLKRYTSVNKTSPELDLVLHTTFEAHAPLSKVHTQAEESSVLYARLIPISVPLLFILNPRRHDGPSIYLFSPGIGCLLLAANVSSGYTVIGSPLNPS